MIACPSGLHTHAPLPERPTGGRCAFYSEGRPGKICGRTPVAVYVNADAKVRNTFRCRAHDREVNRAEAERQGFRRLPVGGDA